LRSIPERDGNEEAREAHGVTRKEPGSAPAATPGTSGRRRRGRRQHDPPLAQPRDESGQRAQHHGQSGQPGADRGNGVHAGPDGGALAPIYVSADGGLTWRLNLVVPSTGGSSTGTSDISVAFASAGGRLYGGILRDPTTDFQTLRTASPANPVAMQTLASRPDNDQPFTHAITRSGRDRVYIGNNDFQ